MMTYVKHIRVTMDRLCNDEITRTAFLAYSPCFKKAYARTEYCLNYFLLSIRNSTLASGGSSTGSSPKSQGALPLEDFMCDALSNMTTCVHNAVKCKENSSRDIKDVLNLMLRGGLSTSLLQQCYPVGKKPNHAHVARSSAPSVRSPGCIKVNFQQSCLYLSLWIILGVSLFLNSFPTAQLYNCIS
ncbi:uncharacterized protein LOC129588181 [Paramacrobiotus metropolitanus]|uniref:uncharacterized protein LOC129588181 n=1 Tax=Paramacrobiotus metropolitanus TaxID=2943436 RepID=UPI00244625FA|nr:uncharacterized protein LOC129588181 [Paramacrobiotus metropolitanus]